MFRRSLSELASWILVGWFFGIPSVLLLCDAAQSAKVRSPVSPDQSLGHFKLAPGLQIELAAAEPEVIDPVAIAFDEDGKLWVVEMTDYPNGPEPGQPPKSRIRVLEDRDGDGYYETSHVFVDKLLFATGLEHWKGGVFVTLAGRLVYLRDTTGDGRADLEETFFSGFAQQNEQLRANHPRFALDNHIYIANGLRGGTIVGHATLTNPKPKPVSISGMDFRFDPLAGSYEAVSGAAQFGLTFDDFGNRFVCSNRNPAKHVVLEDRYLKRNPFLAVPSVTEDVSPAGASSRIFPISTNWTNSTTHIGQFTAACGVLIYRGDALPAEYRGNGLICDPTGNLVHRDVLQSDGSTFRSRPGREGVEFLASPDDWFRPVNLSIGPDGALYVVDMYRTVIEHPHWLPEEVARRLPVDEGNDRGRIYRIVPAETNRTAQTPQLSKATSSELVELLGHPNAWWRDTAGRLLYERQDKSAGPALETLAREGPSPVSRVHALWALEGLGMLTQRIVRTALGDAHPRVREQAVLLSERWLASSPELQRRVVALADDPDPKLKFQVALSLGEISDSERIVEPLKRIALQSATDSWTRFAVISSLPDRAGSLLERILVDARLERSKPGVIRLVEHLAVAVGSRRQPAEIARVLEAALAQGADQRRKSAVQIALLNGLGRGISRRGSSLGEILEQVQPHWPAVQNEVRRCFIEAAGIVGDVNQAPRARRQALALLSYSGFELAGETLIELVLSVPSQQIRLDAIGVLAKYSDKRIGSVLLADFPSQTPAVRRAVLDAMLRDRSRTRTLLAEIQAGRIPATELGPSRVDRLLKHKDPEIRTQATEVLGDFVPADRKKVLDEYRQALSLEADPERGRAVFDKNCATCHRVSNIGVEIGPDIADSLRKTPEALLASILIPNAAIDSNYVSYSVLTADGQTHTGIIAQETASSITLKQAQNKTVTLLRQDIDQIRSSGISLMPDGVEKNISIEQMADLISFIKNWQYIDGRVPTRKSQPGER